MRNEFIMRAAVFIAKLSEASENAHAIKLRYACMALKVINAFIAEEVHASQKHRKGSQFYLSWAQIGRALEISRSAAYTRYSQKGDDE